MLIGQPYSQGATNGPSAGLTLNLSSNNPFRNRAASPNSLASPPPRSPFEDPPPRPISRNPFLDPDFSPASQLVTSPEKMAESKATRSPTAEELFVSHKIICNHSGTVSDAKTLRAPLTSMMVQPRNRSLDRAVDNLPLTDHSAALPVVKISHRKDAAPPALIALPDRRKRR